MGFTFLLEACNLLVGCNHKFIVGTQAGSPVQQRVERRNTGIFTEHRNELDESTITLDDIPLLSHGHAVRCLDWLRAGPVLQIVGDSQVLIDGLLGKSHVLDAKLQGLMQYAHAGFLHLLRRFRPRPPHAREFAQQVPRSDNSAADAPANKALDHRNFRESYNEEVTRLAMAVKQLSLERQHNSIVPVTQDTGRHGQYQKEVNGILIPEPLLRAAISFLIYNM